MKRSSLIITGLILCFCGSILLTSCASQSTSKSQIKNFEKVGFKAAELKQKGELEKAKELILSTLSKFQPKKSPFVENNTLFYYASNKEQSFSHMLGAMAFNASLNDKDAKEKPYHDKYLEELFKLTPWENAVVIPPTYPSLYLIMGSLLIDQKRYKEAITYIDTCTFIWNGFAYAWAEMMYAYISLREFEKAKEIGNQALKINDVMWDNPGKAAILRRFGYIAVEEKDFDKAEEYYLESLKLYESDVARKELQYIKEYKEHNK